MLATVSALALAAIPLSARAEDAAHPTLWIELGGAFDQISRDATGWVPPNLPAPIANAAPRAIRQVAGHRLRFRRGITLQPKGSEWSYTASVRYGHAQRGPKHTHDQSYGELANQAKYVLTTYAFINAKDRTHSTHAIIDFSAGKDIGLGSFHGGIHRTFRRARGAVGRRRDGMLTAFSTKANRNSINFTIHEADGLIVRSYTGIGPAASWDSSTPLAGELNDGFTFDWGANAAVLVGARKRRSCCTRKTPA